MASHETVLDTHLVAFPSKVTRYVRLTHEQAVETIVQLLQKNLNIKNVETKTAGNVSIISARLGGNIAAKVKVKVLSEGEMTVIRIAFSYNRLISAILAVLAATVALSVLLSSPVPMLGILVVLPLVYTANFSAQKLLDVLRETVPYLEREYAREALLVARERWKKKPVDTDHLYRKLVEKHRRYWGDTNVLEYKMKEYQNLGLTIDESI